MKAGFKLLQYMSAGLPIIASPLGFNKEIVSHGWNGFLADSAIEWQQALECLVRDSALRREMGMNGRRYVEENFRLDVAAKRWRDVCETEMQ
jgi:glycosyltransferase involved in cell wall biosynthesis